MSSLFTTLVFAPVSNLKVMTVPLMHNPLPGTSLLVPCSVSVKLQRTFVFDKVHFNSVKKDSFKLLCLWPHWLEPVERLLTLLMCTDAANENTPALAFKIKAKNLVNACRMNYV